MSKSKNEAISWLVYIVGCSDDSYYIGVTNNLSRRLDEHNAGRGSKYTRTRLPVRLLRYFDVPDRSSALKLEALLKKKSRKQKSLIIEGGLRDV